MALSLPSADEIIRALGLVPHPREGGYFRETYRSAERLPSAWCNERYGGGRSVSTAIFYLLTPTCFSEMHRLKSDEVFHFYLGGTVEMLQLWPDRSAKVLRLGSNVLIGELPQLVVPAGVWQGSRLVGDAPFALLGATVAPGFDYADYESGFRDSLLAEFPEHANAILRLTHPS
jgi:predicted cupin superfamily sugar epimerase